MTTLLDDVAKEEHTTPNKVWLGGMESYTKTGTKM